MASDWLQAAAGLAVGLVVALLFRAVSWPVRLGLLALAAAATIVAAVFVDAEYGLIAFLFTMAVFLGVQRYREASAAGRSHRTPRSR